jgi:hypothetical protein
MAVIAEAEDTLVLAAEDAPVSAVALARVGLVAAMVELESAGRLAPMPRRLIHPESQPDDMVAMAGMGKGTTHREARLECRFLVQLRGGKTGLLPGSLLVRQVTLAATTFREIDPALALRANLGSSNARPQLQRVQLETAVLGCDGMRLIGRNPTLKQHKICATGGVNRLDGTMQNVINRITGAIVIIITITGGTIIAVPSCSLAGAIGVGMTDGGIRRGVTIPIIHTTTTTVLSTAMMDLNPIRSLPMFKQRCNSWDIILTQSMECWARRRRRRSQIISVITGYRLQRRSINRLWNHSD